MVRIGYILSLLLIGVCGILLILDLGTPSRFLNMMRHFKFWDPMSIGAWMLGVFGLFAFVSSALSLSAGREARAPLRRKISLVGTIFGFFLASYTGVLLSATALPFWSEARLMGALFLASGASTGMAAISLLLFLCGESGGGGLQEGQAGGPIRHGLRDGGAGAVPGPPGIGRRAHHLGHLAPLFWGGLVVAGLVVPLLLDVLGGAVGCPR